jgi:serine O-acetyltransferase
MEKIHLTGIPDRQAVEGMVNKTFAMLFPCSGTLPDAQIGDGLPDLRNDMAALTSGLTENEAEIARLFTSNLNSMRELLLKDAGYILDSDPAATQVIEVIAIYPGFFALFCYRMANYLSHQDVPLLPRMITEYAHRTTGIDIHPNATIGNPVSIDHGTGIVIGETAEIGNYVKIYQGVTIGALSVDKSKASKKRHPTIEDNVILYSGCTILGGGTVVGRNSIIGGNVWLTESVAPFSVVYHKSEIVVRTHPDYKEPLNFII